MPKEKKKRKRAKKVTGPKDSKAIILLKKLNLRMPEKSEADEGSSLG